MNFPKLGLTALLLSASLLVAGCEDSEERAERHFQSGMELLEDGDVSRALVEFRNVFKLNPRHKEARLTYARAIKENGKFSEAFGQYLRVVEQYPDELEARLELAEMAAQLRNWEEAERHGRRAFEMAPDNMRAQIIVTALDYAKAQRDSNLIETTKQANQARKLREQSPDSAILRRVLIDSHFSNADFDAALPLIDEGIAAEPDAYEMYEAKLRIHLQRDDKDAVGQTLRQMVEQFPENEQVQRFMISWFIERDDMDGAESFLRELANRPGAEDARKVAVFQFIRSTRGEEAARQELEDMIAKAEDPTRYLVIRASMDFDAGDRDQGIAALQTLIQAAESSPEIRDAKIVLARMLGTTGNIVGARAQVEEVLLDDTSHVEALKMRAAWLVDDDRAGDAILDLRTALAQAPRDPDVMTLMAKAHERAGDRELAGERYALAVEVSNKAPDETMRYAVFLLGQQRPDAARAILADALERSPQNIDLLRSLASLHIQLKNWNEVQRMIWRLKAIDTPASIETANAVETDMLMRQERVDDTLNFLQNLATKDGGENMSVLVPLIQTQLRAGRLDDAIEVIQERLTANPEDADLRFLRAGLYVLNGEGDEAETIYRQLLVELPGNDKILRTLYAYLTANGRHDAAGELIDQQIALNPSALNARLLKAERLEKNHDFEGAIAIYEQMYAENSSNIIVANNLASLITTHRDDDESLDRAFAIARRLRGSDVPPLQDTYGWIEYRRGNYKEALISLEPAAKGLPTDPLVQYHLGMTYLALERTEEARAALQNAIQIGGEDPLPQLEKARGILSELGE